MRGFRVVRKGSMVALAALMGSMAALMGLGAAPALAGPVGAAGQYTQNVSLTIPGSKPFVDELILHTNHTFTMFIPASDPGGPLQGPVGTWGQPGLNGTIVLNGTIAATKWRLTAAKLSNGRLGSPLHPGTVFINGHLMGQWWAVKV